MASAWVDGPGEGSPHRLFEPSWLYPGGAWRRHAARAATLLSAALRRRA